MNVLIVICLIVSAIAHACGIGALVVAQRKRRMSEIKVGDLVKWKSQANASRLLKVGVVVCVIPEGKQIGSSLLRWDFSAVPVGFDCHRFNFSLTSKPMDTVSYVVSVKTGKTDAAKRTLYHPRQEVGLAGPDDEEGVFRWHSGKCEWVRV